ncbi:basic-leucine zipper transcription factor family protein [Striga asiatica]|uniref:Basic-leucine zipper transcription factor family protein n=1 Tax=Striga asiatica TaxID=4170 RepID=A0A5A7QK29_STRAF|nr:basic-leucine zipper transcription factor family protein [Striga asiatica]
MKMKINKAVDLSSISVLPPQSRRSSVVTSGLESSSTYGRSQTASQLRPRHSQLTLSQGVSSQHGLCSQLSQNSQDEILTGEKLGYQERENSVRRSYCQPPISQTREDSQMISKTSNNMMRRWSDQEYKSQSNEELEHRIGVMETSLSRLGMILDTVQSDVIQVNRCTKEVSMEMKAVEQKLNIQDDTLQSVSKGQEDIKMCLDVGLKSMTDQLKQKVNQESLEPIVSNISALSEKFETRLVKLQNDLHMDFCKEIQACAMSCSMMISKQKQATDSTNAPMAVSHHVSHQEVQYPNNAKTHLKEQQRGQESKVETGVWTSVKQERATRAIGNLRRNNQIKESLNRKESRVVLDSDEETDEGFSCLLIGKGDGKN